MAKYHGKIGFVTFAEKTPGVDEEIPVEREYFGEVLKVNKRWDTASSVLPELTINNQISIVADQYARDNLFAIRYITWMGTRWNIASVDVQHPRLILSIGGVYNGPTSRPSNGAGGSDGFGCNGKIPTQTGV